MFDTNNFYRNKFPENVNVSVKEYRAPTDESVKLLKELEKEAVNKIESVIKVDNQTFSCVIYKSYVSLFHYIEFVIIYKLNGKERRVVVNTNEEDSVDTVIGKLLKSLSEDIALNLSDSFNRALFHGFNKF